MANIEIQVNAVEPFAESQPFGEAGSYLRIRGVAKGQLDPEAPENKVIVDLDKAPRNARGLVEYETDFFILRPASPDRSNGILIYDVTNRGSKRILQRLDDAPGDPPAAANDLRTAREAGGGFLLGRGYTLVWSGWDPGAPTANNGLGARFPAAIENGEPVTGRIRHEFHIGTRAPGKGDVVRLPYPAVSTDKRRSRLTVRNRESDLRTDIQADAWEFADKQSVRLLPRDSLFAPVKIYELWYEATGSKVLGLGFASVRDLVSFLRYERADRNGSPNPLIPDGVRIEGTGIRHALAFGVSQSGRFLRHFLELGMNDGGHAKRVFDGVMSHVAGAGKVFANHRFGMPGRTATQHEDRLYPENWFPFGNAVTTDPFSRKSGAILRGDPTDPVVIETNSSTEYWQKGASLVHTDPTGQHDTELPANARVYMIAGTQHGARSDASPGPCVNPRNPHSATPALRALFVALEEWVTKGTAPPPIRVPRVADGTAVVAESIKMPAVPGFAVAPGANQIIPPVDWVDPPLRIDNVYGARVCAVDADGNETAGIRLPPIAVPLGTHTGWNVYREQRDELADRDGSFIAFAGTKAEREAARDPRLSLEERYGSREAYVAKIEAEAEALVAERLLLPTDAAAYVEAAKKCDRF